MKWIPKLFLSVQDSSQYLMGTHKLKRGHKVGGFGFVVFIFLTENLEQKYQPPCISKYTHLEQRY